MKGRVEFRSDRTGVVHLAVGKVSMDPAHVKENTLEVVREVIRKKPADAKGDYLASVTLASTMGPGVRVDVRDLSL
jgi:large subunit ribosomal protein L1